MTVRAGMRRNAAHCVENKSFRSKPSRPAKVSLGCGRPQKAGNMSKEVPQGTRDGVHKFLSHLSLVNYELGNFIVNLAVSWRGLYSSDADQQEDYAKLWASNLVESIHDFEDSFSALEDYKDSILELAAIRNHADRIVRGQEPLGVEIHSRLLEGNRDADLNTDKSLEDFAKDLGIKKEDAADLKAFLEFKKGEERAKLPLDQIV